MSVSEEVSERKIGGEEARGKRNPFELHPARESVPDIAIVRGAEWLPELSRAHSFSLVTTLSQYFSTRINLPNDLDHLES